MKIGKIRTAQIRLKMKERALQLINLNKKRSEIITTISSEFMYSRGSISQMINVTAMIQEVKEAKRKQLWEATRKEITTREKRTRKPKSTLAL
jgi:hypothetical protein